MVNHNLSDVFKNDAACINNNLLEFRQYDWAFLNPYEESKTVWINPSHVSCVIEMTISSERECKLHGKCAHSKAGTPVKIAELHLLSGGTVAVFDEARDAAERIKHG